MHPTKYFYVGALCAALVVATICAGYISTTTRPESGRPTTLAGAATNKTLPAYAGSDQSVAAGTTVVLSANGGNASADATLTYKWSFISIPLKSSAKLINPTSASPSFTVDKAGTYIVQLIVLDGKGTQSLPDQVVITSRPARSADTTLTVNVSKTELYLGDSVTISGKLADAEGRGILGQPISIHVQARALGLTHDIPMDDVKTNGSGAFNQSLPVTRGDAPLFITDATLDGWATYGGSNEYKPASSGHISATIHFRSNLNP
ncbi:MAG: PKD domain-containing protein [Halobacteriota archaeon]